MRARKHFVGEYDSCVSENYLVLNFGPQNHELRGKYMYLRNNTPTFWLGSKHLNRNTRHTVTCSVRPHEIHFDLRLYFKQNS